MEKERLDVLLVKRGLYQSREKAKAAIMAGIVLVNEEKEDKCGLSVFVDSQIRIKSKDIPYVSRGGFKLERALKAFELNLTDKVCVDVGASTGGFTHCMLINGAKRIYSIDVGYGQLDWLLRNNEKVVCMERSNIRHVEKKVFKEDIEFVSIDVSFISLEKVLPVVHNILVQKGEVVALIKPQFEAGREKVGKNGVVKEVKTHVEVIDKVIKFSKKLGFSIFGLDYSPIKGPKGNIEFLIYLKKYGEAVIDIEKEVKTVVDLAHCQI